MFNMGNPNHLCPPSSAVANRRAVLHLFRAVTLAMLLNLTIPPLSAWSQEEAPPAESAEEDAAPAVKRLLDLGTIRIKELRPEKNETIKLSFAVHFLLEPTATEEDLATLETWQHRLRDQVIVAVRTAHTNDFREPGLMRLRRIIRFRIEQILKSSMVESLLLSDYSFALE